MRTVPPSTNFYRSFLLHYNRLASDSGDVTNEIGQRTHTMYSSTSYGIPLSFRSCRTFAAGEGHPISRTRLVSAGKNAQLEQVTIAASVVFVFEGHGDIYIYSAFVMDGATDGSFDTNNTKRVIDIDSYPSVPEWLVGQFLHS